MSAFFVDRIALFARMVYNNSVPLSASMAATMRTPKRRTRAMYMFRRFLFFGPCVAVFGPLLALAVAVCLHATSLADFAPYSSPVTGVSLPPMAVFKAATRFSQLVDNLAFALKPPTAQLI